MTIGNNIEPALWTRFNNDSHKWHKGTAARTWQMFTLLARVTNSQATEDGETWPKDTSVPMAKTTILAQQVDAGECKNAQLVEENITKQETAELNGTMNFGAPGAIETITATTLAD